MAGEGMRVCEGMRVARDDGTHFLPAPRMHPTDMNQLA
jgi:hypothetical protein